MHLAFKLLKQFLEFLITLKSFLLSTIFKTNFQIFASISVFKNLNITITVKLWLVFMICTTEK